MENSKKDVNDFGILTWTFEEPPKSVEFLDLTISIERNEIVAKAYQKELNLYMHISSLFNHPTNMIQGIFYSLLRHYKKKEHSEDNYLKVTTKIFNRQV